MAERLLEEGESDEAAPLFAGLDRADSAAVDAHKWLYLPKACGVVLVRRLDDLVAACRPRRMTVVGDFSVRGGLKTTVTARHER